MSGFDEATGSTSVRIAPADNNETTASSLYLIRRVASRPRGDLIRRNRRALTIDLGLAWVLPVALVALWQLAASRGWIDVRFFPSPSSIWRRAIDMLREGTLQDHMLITAKRVLLGFGLGVAAGTAVGVALGSVRRLRVACEPLLNALYTVPKISLLPMLLLIFGIGEKPRVITVGITVFFFMWISTMTSVMAVAPAHRDALTVLGAGRWQMFRHVVAPACLPATFVAMRISAGVSILTVVAVEFVQAGDGLGYLIWHSWGIFLAVDMYVGIVTVALMGVVFSRVIEIVGSRVTRWQPRAHSRSVLPER